MPNPQNYPRLDHPSEKCKGCLDDSTLVNHLRTIPPDVLAEYITSAIGNANKRSRRELLSIPSDATQEQILSIYRIKGRELFKYFKNYCNDPAATAHQVFGKTYIDVGTEQFKLQTIQNERMNSGWRYQFLVKDCAQYTGRFRSVSDIGATEADFNAQIQFTDHEKPPLYLYVSVKNRENTLGGQDWPKAISALENVAVNDRNRIGPYCCIFGIVMGRGRRHIKNNRQGQPYSYNTEVWPADYFWPFFANLSYDEIMTSFLNVLISMPGVTQQLPGQSIVPTEVIESFGERCRNSHLINEEGVFYDPHALVHFFCSRT